MHVNHIGKGLRLVRAEMWRRGSRGVGQGKRKDILSKAKINGYSGIKFITVLSH